MWGVTLFPNMRGVTNPSPVKNKDAFFCLKLNHEQYYNLSFKYYYKFCMKETIMFNKSETTQATSRITLNISSDKVLNLDNQQLWVHIHIFRA